MTATLTVHHNTLTFQNHHYACAIGKGGLIAAADKREGDGCTPMGQWALRECWYRPDRLDATQTVLPLREIHEDDAWCDDPGHELYNRHFKLALTSPSPSRGEGSGATYTSRGEIPPELQSKGALTPTPALPPQGGGGYPRTTSTLKTYARDLRKNLTNAEQRLWHHLRRNQLGGYSFRRQHPFGGRYILDFVCLDKKLVIELDGGQHAMQRGYDAHRDASLAQEGYKVLRFWNNEVLQNTDGVLQIIVEALGIGGTHPHPNPPPSRGRGFSFEHLFREDPIYDLIIPLGYNDSPVIPGKGSAIFLHIALPDYAGTEGCVALAQGDLLELLAALPPAPSILILPD